jgi:histidinol-phosphate aminotransferase
MLSRRDLGRRFSLVAAGIAIGGEAAFAQRSGVHAKDRGQLVLLNANENPDGPPQISIDAMSKALARGGRYHDEDTEALTAQMAASEHLQAEQVLASSGSSEILHCAVDAFTSPSLPLITTLPSYEQPVEIAAAQGHPVIKVPMTPDWAADVRKMIAEAEKARGGLIYVVNPNNPTSSITKKADIAWLVANLPPNTVAMIDEAYIHYSTSPDLASSIPYVQQGKNVIVARTFSKIYGMAGLRIGFGCARPDLIRKMSAYRNNVVPVPSVQGSQSGARLVHAGGGTPREIRENSLGCVHLAGRQSLQVHSAARQLPDDRREARRARRDRRHAGSWRRRRASIPAAESNAARHHRD